MKRFIKSHLLSAKSEIDLWKCEMAVHRGETPGLLSGSESSEAVAFSL